MIKIGEVAAERATEHAAGAALGAVGRLGVKAGKVLLRHGDEIVDLTRRAAKTCSFSAGTLVMTKEGLKPIEEVKAGDYVLARNDLTGEQDWRRVVTAYNSWHQDILSLTLTDSTGGNETLITTSEHPFYVTGRGWTRADALKVGDLIVTADGQVVRVATTEWLKTEQVAYNMEVEEFHTYFVGQKGVWVHNTCRTLRPDEKATLGRLESRGLKLEASPHVGEEFRDSLGRTYDVVGGGLNASQHFDPKKFLASIDRHLLKSNDFTVIDLTGF